jgi:hypothetical protein
MKPDPGLEPTREVRKRISREHANDPRRLVEYYMEYQRRFSDRLRWARGTDQERREAAEHADSADDPPRHR